MKQHRQFNNKKSESHGISFQSQTERDVYHILLCRQQAGEISEIKIQDHLYICGPEGHKCSYKKEVGYIADFKCTRPDGSTFHVEAKGYPNERWPTKVRLYKHWGPDPLEIWVKDKGRLILKETIIPGI